MCTCMQRTATATKGGSPRFSDTPWWHHKIGFVTGDQVERESLQSEPCEFEEEFETLGQNGQVEEWLEIREPKGDVNRQSLNLHQCAIVGDKFMRKLEQGDAGARNKWSKLLRKRKATGEPYIMFKGNVNKKNPKAYKENGKSKYMVI